MLNPTYFEPYQEAEEGAEDEFDKVHRQVKEYSTIKQIMSSNNESIRLKGHKIEAVDCNLLSVLIEDVIRHKTVEKMTDENYIFIRRAVDVKTRAMLQKR